MTDKLIELAERCEAATGPDRELDALIDVSCRVGLPTMPEWVWRNFPNNWRARPDNRVEVFNKDGLGGIHWEPQKFTASLDVVLTLVPEGWFWRAGRTSAFQAWAGVNRTHPDHCDKNDEFFARREYWEPMWTPVLALASAALRARAALSAERE
jgi:hypothetical protein